MKILIAFTALFIAFILQQFRFLSLGHVNPNLILIGFLFLVFKRANLMFLGSLLLGVALTALLFIPQWFLQVLVVLLLIMAFYFIKNFMTGNRFFDFLLAVILGTIVFYTAVSLLRFSFSAALILGEILYNTVLGAVIWNIFGPKYETKFAG